MSSIPQLRHRLALQEQIIQQNHLLNTRSRKRSPVRRVLLCQRNSLLYMLTRRRAKGSRFSYIGYSRNRDKPALSLASCLPQAICSDDAADLGLIQLASMIYNECTVVVAVIELLASMHVVGDWSCVAGTCPKASSLISFGSARDPLTCLQCYPQIGFTSPFAPTTTHSDYLRFVYRLQHSDYHSSKLDRSKHPSPPPYNDLAAKQR